MQNHQHLVLMWGSSTKIESFAFKLKDSVGIGSKILGVIDKVLVEKSAAIVILLLIIVKYDLKIRMGLLSCKWNILKFLGTSLWILEFNELSFNGTDVLIWARLYDSFFCKIKLFYFMWLTLLLSARCLRLFVGPVSLCHVLGLGRRRKAIRFFRV